MYDNTYADTSKAGPNPSGKPKLHPKMSENLNKKPPKGILKQSSSFDTNVSFTPRSSITSLTASTIQETLASGGNDEDDEEPLSPGGASGGGRKKSAKFDEMNILETLHPPDKDYGFMKIEEPKTPFNYFNDGDEEGSSSQKLDPEDLLKRMQDKGLPSCLVDNEEEEEDDSPEGVEKKKFFESKRKLHYNEYFAVKLARQLMEKEDSDDDTDPDPPNKFIPQEEVSE